jgi:hypothetical protein
LGRLAQGSAREIVEHAFVQGIAQPNQPPQN